ncbi:hypothetical protein ACFL67_00680 [candidate division KSB1 bacterium]
MTEKPGTIKIVSVKKTPDKKFNQLELIQAIIPEEQNSQSIETPVNAKTGKIIKKNQDNISSQDQNIEEKYSVIRFARKTIIDIIALNESGVIPRYDINHNQNADHIDKPITKTADSMKADIHPEIPESTPRTSEKSTPKRKKRRTAISQEQPEESTNPVFPKDIIRRSFNNPNFFSSGIKPSEE